MTDATARTRLSSGSNDLIWGVSLPLLLLGGVAAACLAGPLHARMVELQLALAAAGLAWFASLARALSGRAPRLRTVLIVAVLLRAIGLAGDGQLSDDQYRYAYEGALVLEGVSPYAAAPDSDERRVFRERWPELTARINHPDVSAAYPPLMQLSAAAAVAAAGGPEPPERALFALRALYAGVDLLALVPLALLARSRGRSPHAAWIAWGWSPIVVLAFAGTGHFDALAIALTLGALAAFVGTGSPWWGRGLLAGAVLVKYLPILVLAARSTTDAWWRRALAVAALVAAGSAAPLLLEGGGRGLWSGLGEYGLRWESTSVAYRIVEPLFEPGGALGAGGAVPIGGDFDGGARDPRRLGRALVAGLLGVTLLLAWIRRLPAVEVAALAFSAFVLLSPTLHPWYLTWPAALVGLVPRTWVAALVAAAPLLYWPLEGWHARGEWLEPSWLWPAVLAPCMLFALAERWLPRAWRPIR